MPPIAARVEPVRDALLVFQRESDPGMRQRDPRELLGHVAHLGLVGAEELAAGRHGVKQIPHFDGRARRRRTRPGVADLVRFDLDGVRYVLIAPA